MKKIEVALIAAVICIVAFIFPVFKYYSLSKEYGRQISAFQDSIICLNVTLLEKEGVLKNHVKTVSALALNPDTLLVLQSMVYYKNAQIEDDEEMWRRRQREYGNLARKLDDLKELLGLYKQALAAKGGCDE